MNKDIETLLKQVKKDDRKLVSMGFEPIVFSKEELKNKIENGAKNE